ncbi:ribonuclease H-like domain-containing protein, partial [Tanacetum coccineum]
MPTTMMMTILRLQMMKMLLGRIDIRWQVAMITARIRKFMRKTGRPIDLKPKNGITFDKSKIECFNCQKLGHFARECRFAKYQENRANGKKTKMIQKRNYQLKDEVDDIDVHSSLFIVSKHSARSAKAFRGTVPLTKKFHLSSDRTKALMMRLRNPRSPSQALADAKFRVEAMQKNCFKFKLQETSRKVWIMMKCFAPDARIEAIRHFLRQLHLSWFLEEPFTSKQGLQSLSKALYGLPIKAPRACPQWKYLVHVLLHCLSPKSTSWEQFGTNIASALVGLATNRKFNFSLMIMNGMLGHISNGTPFLMYPRFIQLFLNKQLEGVARPQDFIPSVTLPSKVFTFMRKHSPKFSCRITPLTPPMLEVVTALAAEEEHSTSPHSRAASSARDAQGTPTQSAAQASISTAQDTAGTQGTAQAQDTAEVQGTDNSQGTAEVQGTAAIPKSPNDYTPTDASQTSGGDEGLLDLYALNREVKRLKRQTLSQAKQIIKLKTKLKKLSKMVQPVVQHHTFWVESQKHKKRRKKRKKQKKKVSSVKLGRNKEEGTLSEEHYVQDDYTADPFFEDIVDKDAAVTPDFERKSVETEALERKSDETEEINVEEKEGSNVKSGDTEELDLETFQSTARQSTITPRTLIFDDEAGPSSPTQNIEPEEQFKVDEVLVGISRPRGLSIPGPIQSQPQP